MFEKQCNRVNRVLKHLIVPSRPALIYRDEVLYSDPLEKRLHSEIHAGKKTGPELRRRWVLPEEYFYSLSASVLD